MSTGKRIFWYILTFVAILGAIGIFFSKRAKNEILVQEEAHVQVEQVLPVGPFERLKVGGVFHVVLREGAEELLLNAPGNLKEEIQGEVRDGTLYLNVGNASSPTAEVTVFIPETLKEIDISGMARLEAENPIDAESLKITAAGMAVVDLGLNVSLLEVTASGSAKVTLHGSAGELLLGSSGTAKVDARDLSTLKATVQASGSGEADLKVEEHLTVNASGLSEVRYSGKPKVEAKTSGGAKVKERE